MRQSSKLRIAFIAMFVVFAVTFLAQDKGSVAFAQTQGCIFLEGLKLPCFGGGVACGTCESTFDDETMNNACMGTLVLPNPTGCSQGITCGRKCCSACGNPDDYYTCQTLPGACDADGNPISCGTGTRVPSCDDPQCASQAQNRCGQFSCTCGITCQGERETKTCYRWVVTSQPSGGSCGCSNVGSSPGTCAGTPTGASECGGDPNPCNLGNESQCLGASSRCWNCTWSPGFPGTCTKYCSPGAAQCYTGEVTSIQLCGDCPGGTSETPPTGAPPGPLCSSLPPLVCANNGDCPDCSASQCP